MSWLLLSIIIGIIGFIFLVVKTINKQIETGFSVNFVTTGLALVTESFGTFSDKAFALLSGDEATNNIVQLVTGIIIIGIGIWMWMYTKNKLSILNLLGMKERRIEEHRKDVGLNRFEFKEREVDLGIYARKMSLERYEEATNMIEIKMKSFYSENKDVKKGYTGTAPIPLTMFAGYCDQGAPTVEFFEYHKLDRKYMRLDKSKKNFFSSKRPYPDLQLRHPLDTLNLEDAEEVVVGVSTTIQIQEEQVQQFNAPFIDVSIETPKQNSIMYEDQLHDYKKFIFDLFVELSGYSSIKKIHLLLSCQSSLVFEIGKILTTDTYMVEIINYNYVNNSGSTGPCYNWGISFNNQGTRYIQCFNGGIENELTDNV